MKMRYVLRWLAGFILLAVVALTIVQVSVATRLPLRYRSVTAAGVPFMEAHEGAFLGEVTTVAADDAYVYACFGKRHIVQVLEPDGSYVTTIAISDAHNRGGTLIASEQDGRVVLFSDAHRYTFEDARLVAFEQRSDWLPEQRVTTDAAGSTYTVQHGSVVKQPSGGAASTFYATPLPLRLMNHRTMQLVGPLLIGAALLLYAACRKGEARTVRS